MSDSTATEETQELISDMLVEDQAVDVIEEISTDSEVKSEAENNDVVVLDEVLHISQLDVLYQVLSSNLDTSTEIKIDASKVEKADGVSLQTLSSFYQSAQRENIKVSWLECSEAFTEASEVLGVNSLIGING